MSDYTYGVQAIRPLIGNAEDIARFDLAMSVASGDIRAETSTARARSAAAYPPRGCQALVRWAWSGRPEQIVWAEGAEEAVYRPRSTSAAYTEDPPLIQAANVREKVARIAVALAARLFSTDERGEISSCDRATSAARSPSLDRLYSMKGFGYARAVEGDHRGPARAENPKNIKLARRVLTHNAGLDKFLRARASSGARTWRRSSDIDREEANAIISELVPAPDACTRSRATSRSFIVQSRT
jgi:hypothetical protein